MKAINEVGTSMANFNMLLQNLVSEQQQMVENTTINRKTSSVLNVKSRVHGRDNEKEAIVNKLLNPDCASTETNFQILPIVGDGGIGKTTLAQFVYDDKRVKGHFGSMMWVCVSNPFDVNSVSEKLYESAFRAKANFGFGLIQEKLAEKLQFEKFLIVLDDAWNDNDSEGWQKLLAPLKSGKKGSMILLTTRMESVARKIGLALMDPIFLKGINKDAYWDLFVECVFGGKMLEDPSDRKRLEDIGRRIVEKLERSPLAVKTVGGILRSRLDDNYWTSVLESEIWSLKHEQHDIMPALRLSYQLLDSHLKPCFSFCSLFPQDHWFRKEDLVYMWMAVGLVPRYWDGNQRPEDIGSQFFDDLVKKSLLELTNSSYGINFYIMHDLLHGLAQFVSRGECFRYTGDSTNIPNTVRHLDARVSEPSEFKNISGLKHLRTLILHFDQNHPEFLSIINGILKELKNLRILRLTSDDLCEFPDGINNLLHLRYLYLCGRHRIIPKIIVNLHLLQKLSFDCKPHNLIDSQEVNVGKLINLRNLRFPFVVKVTPVGVGRLMSLQDMGTTFYVKDESGYRISELKDMIELRNLSIEGVGYVGSVEEADQAELKNKVNLHKLCLNWGYNNSIGEDAKFDEELLDHLEPHPDLKSLEIIDHKSGKPPNWLITLSVFQLVNITVSSCRWECLPSLEKLPYLKSLFLSNMVALKNIKSQVGNFPSLEVLSFLNMPELEEWISGKEPRICLPRLREAKISGCPKLRSLPPLPSSLETLSLDGVGLVALPKIWQDQNRKSQSLPSLAGLWIINCSKLESLSEGMFQHPNHFTTLRELVIWSCEGLTSLPQGGFSKFIALKKLMVESCPQLQGHKLPKYFLPSSLESLHMCSIGSLDAALPKALEHVDSIISLSISDCAVTRVTPKGVLARWKKLREVALHGCKELASLESLQLLSINALHIEGCSKLIAAIPSQLTLHESEIEQTDIVAAGTLTNFRKWFLVCSGKALTCLQSLLVLCTLILSILRKVLSKFVTMKIPFSVDELHIDDPLLLAVEPLRTLSSVQKLTIKDCSELRTLPGQWFLQNCSTLQEISFLKLSSLESFPPELKSLSCLRELTMRGASMLQSLPELPPQLERMTIGDSSEELKRRCRETGEDWPKLAGKLVVFQDDYKDVETIDGRSEAMKNNATEW